jgi:hypothetical protein
MTTTEMQALLQKGYNPNDAPEGYIAVPESDILFCEDATGNICAFHGERHCQLYRIPTCSMPGRLDHTNVIFVRRPI